MLAEKFFLTLETIISHTADSESARHSDGAPRVVCGKHVPIVLPEVKPSNQVVESQIAREAASVGGLFVRVRQRDWPSS
jgi:hypothetical protein